MFKRWLRKLLIEDPEIDYSNQEKVRVESPELFNRQRAIQFIIHHAIGGKVIETRRYDHKTDTSDNSIYVIVEDQNLGQEIEKIITLESLKR